MENSKQSNKHNILFFIPSPRDIPEVKQPIIDLLYGKYDVVWFKYFKELEAYQKAQQLFLNDDKHYDYLCIIPDDLIINDKGLLILLNELENPSISLPEFGYKYPVLSGICNISYINEDQQNKIAAAQAVIPDVDRQRFTIFWNHFLRYDELIQFQSDLIQVLFIGFSCQFIHRKVLEKVKFRHDNPDRPTSGIDTFFSYDTRSLKIPMFIHRKARFLHLKGLSARFSPVTSHILSVNPDQIFTGVYKPYIMFVSASVSK